MLKQCRRGFSGFWTEHHNKGRGMKVSNNQRSSKGDSNVSPDTLNDWQRKDAAKNAAKATEADKEARTQTKSQSPPRDSSRS
jgi:hypothetical protein